MAAKPGATSTEASEEGKYLGWWKTISGAVVVLVALGALVLSTHLVLDNFKTTTTTCDKDCQEEGGKEDESATTDTASVSASSAVAVLTPVIAGIVGIAGCSSASPRPARRKARKSKRNSRSPRAKPKAHPT